MMGTQASRNELMRKRSNKNKLPIGSKKFSQNKYNPTQPSQFAKILTSEEYQRKLYQKECLEQEKSSI